jgi:hypothetical protein
MRWTNCEAQFVAISGFYDECYPGSAKTCKNDTVRHMCLIFSVWLFGYISWIIVTYNKQNRCTNFSNLFWKDNLHVSDSSSVHHREFFTLHTAMVHVIEFGRQLASRIRLELTSSILIVLESSLQTCVRYTNSVCTVKNSWRWTEELSETCRI